MENKCIVSVIIPMYNSEKTIIKALDSVVNQTFKEKMEIIITNDGSTDDSLAIVKEYKAKLNKNNIEMIIIDKENGGVSSARNAGLRIAKGKYIALLDSDDEWKLEKIEKQIEILHAYPEIDFLGCERNNEITKIFWKKLQKLQKIKLSDLLIKMFPQTSTAIFKSIILRDVGYYDENQKYSEDGNFWLRICAQKNFYMLQESLVITGNGKYNFGASGLSSNLVEMERGCHKNLLDMFDLKYINKIEYIIYRIFYYIKYMRRLLIVKLREKSNV